LVVAFGATLHVGLFGWIEAAARCLDERKRTAHLPIATTYTLAAVEPGLFTHIAEGDSLLKKSL
jgi:hypothetical protein